MDELISVADFEVATRRSLQELDAARALAGARNAGELDASWLTRAPWA